MMCVTRYTMHGICFMFYVPRRDISDQPVIYPLDVEACCHGEYLAASLYLTLGPNNPAMYART